MRDLFDISAAFEELKRSQTPAALATVVAIEGSSYRKPGARMLVAADGRTWGGISGCCLEADVARRARQIIGTDLPTLCRYETGDDADDILEPAELPRDPGVSLGCGGAIEILLQPITLARPAAIEFIQQAVNQDVTTALATVYRVGASPGVSVGDQFTLPMQIEHPLAEWLREQLLIAEQDRSRATFGRFIAADGWADLLVEQIIPPVTINVYGDGRDAGLLVELSQWLGWKARWITTKPKATSSRAVTNVVAADDHALQSGLHPGPSILCTHNWRRDVKIIQALSQSPTSYIGLLGPRQRTARVLRAAGLENNFDFRSRLFAPVGLDIGADNPEQIALAVLAEVQAVLAHRSAGSLRYRTAPIHRDDPATDALKAHA